MYEYKAIITDVYDGDTFDFAVDLGFSITVKEKIRLYGINTPEIKGVEKVKGNEVKEYVEGLILGSEVFIQVYKKGKYGRYVADVWIDEKGNGKFETNLTDLLLEKGYGVEFMRDER